MGLNSITDRLQIEWPLIFSMQPMAKLFFAFCALNLVVTDPPLFLQGGSRPHNGLIPKLYNSHNFPIVAPKLLLVRDGGGGAANVGVWQTADCTGCLIRILFVV